MTHLVHGLRIASTLACGVVLVSFMLWATEETKSASAQQAAQAGGAAGPHATPAAVQGEPEHDGLRGTIDSANDTLVAPFEGVSQSTNEWVEHGVPALLALLAYGVLARLLLAYVPQRA